MGGAFYAQGIGVAVQRLHHAISQSADGLAVFKRAADDFVVDIRDIAHVGDLVAAGFEPAFFLATRVAAAQAFFTKQALRARLTPSIRQSIS